MNTRRAACIAVFACVLLTGCQNGQRSAATEALTTADNAFSVLSAQQGFAAAFQRYALDTALLLPEQRAPLQGRKVIEQSLEALPAGTQLSWTPQGAESSGNLGYTWGIYTLTGRAAGGQTTAAYGKYLSVWRQQSGEWKLAVMMLNTSPGPAG